MNRRKTSIAFCNALGIMKSGRCIVCGPVSTIGSIRPRPERPVGELEYCSSSSINLSKFCRTFFLPSASSSSGKNRFARTDTRFGSCVIPRSTNAPMPCGNGYSKPSCKPVESNRAVASIFDSLSSLSRVSWYLRKVSGGTMPWSTKRCPIFTASRKNLSCAFADSCLAVLLSKAS